MLGIPGAVVATGAGLWIETRRVATAPLPHFEDLDPSGTYGDPGAPRLTMAALGDSSITAPGLSSGAESWIAQLAAGLPRRTALRSLARGGSRVRDVIEGQLEAALATEADLYVLAVGANDTLHGTLVRRFRVDLEAVLVRLAERAPVLSLGIGDLSVIPRIPPSLKPLVRWRCSVIDRIHREVAEEVEGVVRVPVHEVADPGFAQALDELFVEDRFHPNGYGHSLWAALFRPFVQELLTLPDNPANCPL